MHVKIYDIDDNGNETFRSLCDLRECFPIGPDTSAEYIVAHDELDRVGRYWVGGGAAPLVLMILKM
jgi:hypothetical protein